MNILAVDDERLALEHLSDELKKVFPQGRLHSDQDAFAALDWAGELAERGETLDYAFLDIQMRGIDGLELARRLKLCQQETRIFFCTGYSGAAADAYGFLLKPTRAERIGQLLSQTPPQWRETPNPLPGDVRAQTFGRFELLVNGTPLPFAEEKARELLAFLVDRRGVPASPEQIAAALWEGEDGDRKRKSRVSAAAASLRKTLKGAGLPNLLVQSRNRLAIDPNKIKCDAYDFEKWDMSAVNAFRGAYMTGYSWAAFAPGKEQTA